MKTDRSKYDPYEVEVEFSDGEKIVFTGIVDRLNNIMTRAKRLWVSTLTKRFNGDYDTLSERLDNNARPTRIIIRVKDED